jgi:ribonuclease P protein component
LIIGKRFAPQAVQRNRIKRLLRENCRVESAPGRQIVVRLRAPLGPGAFSPDFAKEAAQLWHTASSLFARAARVPAQPAAKPDRD